MAKAVLKTRGRVVARAKAVARARAREVAMAKARARVVARARQWLVQCNMLTSS